MHREGQPVAGTGRLPVVFLRRRPGSPPATDRVARQRRQDRPRAEAENIEKTHAKQPTEPIDKMEPAEPMDRMDPLEPIDRMDPLEPMDRTEPDEPGERRAVPMAAFSHCAGDGEAGGQWLSTSTSAAGRRPVTTSSALAQTWFTRGLVWTYAFNHEEAIWCFEQAIEADPGCVLAYWGVAYALGPNYNKPWESFDPVDLTSSRSRAHAATAAAADRLSAATPAERALVAALAHRYPAAAADADGSVWNRQYAAAMREVYLAHPGDLDVAALFADALMNLTPWALWDITTGEPAEGAATVEIRAVLEQALERDDGRAHPGILHLYIHLMEMSPRPQDALWVGDLLRHLVPDAGHLLHMPTHLDVLCGDYRSVVSSNEVAIAADDRLTAKRGTLAFYTLYRAHNDPLHDLRRDVPRPSADRACRR